MRFRTTRPLLMLVTTTATLAVPAGHSVAAGPDEHAEPQRRLAIAAADQAELLVIDPDSGDQVARLALESSATYASALTANGRFLLAAHEDGVTIVDGGVWSDAHGDHAHHYAADPAVLGRIDGDHPSHLVSNGDVSALWFDGLGTAAVIDVSALADGVVTEYGRVGAGEPHHGFAIPAEDGEFVVSALAGAGDDELPDSLTVVNRDNVAASSHTCTETHGEASFGDGIFGAACADGVLFLSEANGEWESELVPYPETGDVDPFGMGAARMWGFATADAVEIGISALGTTHLAVVNRLSRTIVAYDVGEQIATFGLAIHAPSERAVVLTTDGAVLLVDIDTGDVLGSADVVAPFEEGEEFGGTYHQLVIGGDTAYVSDPANNTIVPVDIADEAVVAGQAIDVGVEPAFVEVFNGS